MNNIPMFIQKHRSIRTFLNKDIDIEVLNEVIKSAQSMPSSHNSQHVSVIAVRSKIRKSQISALAGNQPYIVEAPVFLVFVVDFYKTSIACNLNDLEQKVHHSLDSLLVGSFDAGLAMGATIIAAESMGLGTVPIGSLRTNMGDICKILNLPKYTFPVVGLCVGYPATNGNKKPRLPLPTFYHEETYQENGMEFHVKEYDEIMHNYLHNIVNRPQEKNWSYYISNVYKQPENDTIIASLKNQGFLPISFT